MALINPQSKSSERVGKRADAVWGAWAFFRCYFKASARQDVFMVQHDMENMYMWAFKERPHNALGKMQLRSYMNGQCRHGERPFPFPATAGFLRSHRMQRKHYRGLSNPQCIHGLEPLPLPLPVPPEDRTRWAHLTGRPWDFTLPPDACDFSAWRSPPLSFSAWGAEFSGAMTNVSGPVTAAKTIYEDELSYLIVVSLPCVDVHGVRVSWRNTPTHGVVKVSGVTTSQMPFIRRRGKLFRLLRLSSDHCPPGDFAREIRLSTRILEGANIEAYYHRSGAVLEILVPKRHSDPEEHEIRVCFLRPKPD